MTEQLLEVRELLVRYPGTRRQGDNDAVSGVSFEVGTEETVGLVGESGSGKSTVAHCVVGLQKPTSGSVTFMGRDIWAARGKNLRAARRQMQIVFQDPTASLNPRMKIGEAIAEPLLGFGVGTRRERQQRAAELLDAVGLRATYADRYPRRLSGGELQRVVIARAIALRPQLVVCDEAVSALDVSVRAQILNLLKDLQEQYKVAYLFIAHDLAVTRAMSDRVAVMKGGRIVESGPAARVLTEPEHAYTRSLLNAVPRIPRMEDNPTLHPLGAGQELDR
jgi:ABC-type glutathione transport system ATPase component